MRQRECIDALCEIAFIAVCIRRIVFCNGDTVGIVRQIGIVRAGDIDPSVVDDRCDNINVYYRRSDCEYEQCYQRDY